MTGWIVFGAVSAFLLLLLLAPIRFCFSYDEQPKLTVWVAFVPIKIVSERTDAPKKEPSKKPKRKQAKKKEKPGLFSDLRENRGAGGFLGFLKKLLHIILRTVRQTGAHLVAERCEAEIVVGGEDSAAAAQRYGAICAALFPVWSRLLSLTHCRRHSLRIRPDFLSNSYRVDCTIRIRLRVIWVVRAAFSALCSLFGLVLKRKIQARQSASSAQQNRA